MLHTKCRNILRVIDNNRAEFDMIYDMLEGHVIDLCVTPLPNLLVFKTILVAPNKVIKHLSCDFPHLTFLLEGKVEDKYVSRTTIKGGVILDFEEIKPGGQSEIWKEYAIDWSIYNQEGI